MLDLDIPGLGQITIENIVLDYNGTLAVDGTPLPNALDLLSELSGSFNIYIITADTHGSVNRFLAHKNIAVQILEREDQCRQKAEFIAKLGTSKTAAIGNGYNDHLMLKEAVIGMAVLQEEGLSSKAAANADLIFGSIYDALDCLRKPKRIIASLRR
jgi:soluble P-type ATPase